MKISKVKLLVRIIEILIIVASIKLTPIAINYANEIRQYKAYGGEYLIPVFGLAIVMLLETIYETIRTLRRGEYDARS